MSQARNGHVPFGDADGLDGPPPWVRAVDPANPLAAQQYDADYIRVVRLAGECDIATREALAHHLETALADDPLGVVFDLTQLRLCDAGCIGQLLVFACGHAAAIAGAGGIVARALDVLDPVSLLPRYDTVPAAVTALTDCLLIQ